MQRRTTTEASLTVVCLVVGGLVLLGPLIRLINSQLDKLNYYLMQGPNTARMVSGHTNTDPAAITSVPWGLLILFYGSMVALVYCSCALWAASSQPKSTSSIWWIRHQAIVLWLAWLVFFTLVFLEVTNQSLTHWANG